MFWRLVIRNVAVGVLVLFLAKVTWAVTAPRLEKLVSAGNHWVQHHQDAFRRAAFSLVVMTWILAATSSTSCRFVSIDGMDIGFFSYCDRAFGGSCRCRRFEEGTYIMVDAIFHVSRGYAALSCLFTSAALALVILLQQGLLQFSYHRSLLWLVLRICIYFASWAVLLTFVLFGSHFCDETGSNCRIGVAGVVATVNTILLTVLNVLLFLAKPSDDNQSSDAEIQARSNGADLEILNDPFENDATKT